MGYGVLWVALGLMLIAEGLMPFVAPDQWRRLFLTLLKMSDAQIRFAGVICLGLGLLLICWFAP